MGSFTLMRFDISAQRIDKGFFKPHDGDLMMVPTRMIQIYRDRGWQVVRTVTVP